MKRALSLLLALLMAASLVMPQAWAAGLQEPEPDAVVQQTQPDTAEPDAQLPQADTLAGNAAGLTPITRTKNAVASGVTLEKVVMRNVNGRPCWISSMMNPESRLRSSIRRTERASKHIITF